MFIDSHAHIDGTEFDIDRDAVVQRALDAQVTTILNVGTGDPHSDAFERAIELGNQHEFVYSAIGTHPHDARLYDEAAETKTKRLIAAGKRVVAWGEIGLDFHYDNSPREVQMDVFARQLRSASELNLPVIIHTREAEKETVEILEREYQQANRRGVFHCFTSSLDLARSAVDLGFFVSFSGIITFKKAEDLREVVKYLPLDRILVETDCPFLSPIPYRGKRNEPAFVVEVARCIAGLKDVSVERVASQTSENFRDLFQVQSHR